MTTIHNADLIRAVLDGKTVQCNEGRGWYDLQGECAVIELIEHTDREFRIKPDPAVKWASVGMTKDGVFIHGHEHEGMARHAARMTNCKVLRLELDPDTLEVISAKTEAV